MGQQGVMEGGQGGNTPLDFASHPLHLLAYTLVYKREVLGGTLHKQARATAQQFCTSHFADVGFLQQFVGEGVRWEIDRDARLEHPNQAVRLACGRPLACMALGVVVGRWVEVGDRLGEDGVLSVGEFEDKELAKAMDIAAYCQRLGSRLRCSASSVVVCAVLLKRVARRHPKPLFTSATGHRLVLTALVVAIKWTDDLHRPIKHYARVGRVSVAALDAAEAALLRLLGYDVFVSPAEFEKNRRMLEGVVDLGLVPECHELRHSPWARLCCLCSRIVGRA